MLKVRDQIIGCFDAAGETDKVGRDACSGKLGIIHLTVGGIGGVQTAGAGICHMRFDRSNAKLLHHALCGGTPTLYSEADNTAGAVGHILHSKLILLITGERGITHPLDGGML